MSGLLWVILPIYSQHLVDTGKIKFEPKGKKKICIVAFSDVEGNSVAYKKFDNLERAVEFYKKQLEKDEVNVISTRKTIIKSNECKI